MTENREFLIFHFLEFTGVETMGDSERVSIPESQIPENNRNPVPIAVSMLLLGLFAPYLMVASDYGWVSEIFIQSFLWTFRITSMIDPYSGFSLTPIFVLPVMFPILLLRSVPVLQLYRYYNRKTSKKLTYIVCLFGDGFFLIYGFLFVIIAFGYAGLLLPLPFQLLFGWIILWRFPRPEPTTPWVSESEPKSWWEKKTKPPEEKQEQPTKDDDDVLW
jgi:hypothetical protein